MSGPLDVAAEAVMERHSDRSACAYYQTVDKPDVPTESCTFGCWDEPQCQTCTPSEGWPVEDVRRRYAALLAEVDGPDLGVPGEDDYLDAIAVLEGLHAAGWRLVQADDIDPHDGVLQAKAEWTPEVAP